MTLLFAQVNSLLQSKTYLGKTCFIFLFKLKAGIVDRTAIAKQLCLNNIAVFDYLTYPLQPLL